MFILLPLYKNETNSCLIILVADLQFVSRIILVADLLFVHRIILVADLLFISLLYWWLTFYLLVFYIRG